MDPLLLDEIRCQWYKLDRLHENYSMMYGGDDRAWNILYDDFMNVYKFIDDFEDGLSIEFIVRIWWASLTPEDRDKMFV